MTSRLAPYLKSVARIVFGFLVLRHGLEQWFGFPEVSEAARLSFEGALELLALPAGILLMFGLAARPAALVMAVGYVLLYFVGPLQEGPFPHRNGGDPVLLNGFFFLYLAAAGAGPWSLDRLRGLADDASPYAKWAPAALGALRIVAGLLFFMHGMEKFIGVGGGRIDRNILTIRGLAGWLESVGGPLFTLGLFMRPVAFVLSGEMAVAYFRSWAPRGFWESFSQPGMEASILFCYLFLFMSAAGPGQWSVAEARKRD